MLLRKKLQRLHKMDKAKIVKTIDPFSQKQLHRQHIHLLRPATFDDVIKVGTVVYVDNAQPHLLRDVIRGARQGETDNQFEMYLEYFNVKIRYKQLFVKI